MRFSMYTIVHIAEICYIIKLQEKLTYFKLHVAMVIYSEVPKVYCLHFQDDRNGSNACCMYFNLKPKEILTEHMKKPYRNQFVRLQ